MSDAETYIQKIEREIKSLLNEHKHYWYDFNVKTKDAKIIEGYFSKIYTVELKPCSQNQFCDIIIDLTKLTK